MSRSAAPPIGWSTDAVEHDLRRWIDDGVVGRFEVQLVAAVLRAAPERPTDNCLLALAIAARAARLGHVCLDLGAAQAQVTAAHDDEGGPVELTLPDPAAWRAELASSPIVTTFPPEEAEAGHRALVRPLVLEGNRLYLHRLWSFEIDVAAQFADRIAPDAGIRPPVDEAAAVEDALVEVFGGIPVDEVGSPDLQFVAARRALTRPVTVIAGGPGTGKTHTVARILAAALLVATEEGKVFRVALAAPTGKAATRMKEAVDAQVSALVAIGRLTGDQAATLRSVEPTTIHRLLGRKSRTAFLHDRMDPLLHDLVVIDETSMVSLPLLARLLGAVRPEARLVLVGDPFQPASIAAGTVMADMVGPRGGTEASEEAPLAGRVTELRRGHRFQEGSTTDALALSIRDGDADAVMRQLAAGDPEVHWIRPDDAGPLDDLRR